MLARRSAPSPSPSPRVIVLALGMLLNGSIAVAAQQGTGTVTGLVTRQSDGRPLGGVVVLVRGTSISGVSGTDGRYALLRVPEGEHILLFRWLGFRPTEVTVRVTAGGTHTADVALEPQPISLGEVVVEAPSRGPERVVEAPAAVAVIDPAVSRDYSSTGQAPLAIGTAPGVDVVQSGVNDFNVNARGFNSSLNRRVLVMQDGRDLAVAFLGSQEWNGLSVPLADMERIEVVRGPGSALYGANAFSGVVDMSTPLAREVAGTKVSVAGGELSTFRGDVRHAGMLGEGAVGYRLNVGYYRSDSWTRSRTARDTSDFEAEYGEVNDSTVRPPPPGFELRPLDGQTIDSAATFVARGEPDPLVNVYGSARFDYYALNGSVATVEGGAAQVENEVLIIGTGRVQIPKALKPWARANWAHRNFNVMAWWSGRRSLDTQFSLTTGIPIEEKSDILHVEGQYNRSLAEGRARVVLGASARQYNVDTEGTLMAPADDDRSDGYYSAFGQVEYRVVPQLRAVVAGRWDKGDLFDAQFSPKGALVFTPNEQHSVRVTVNQAFQTPNYSEFFLHLVAGATTGPATLEQGLETYFAAVRQSPFAADPNLPETPTDLPWNFSPTTLTLGLGNRNLEVEKVTGWEVGYKGLIGDRLYVGADAYVNRLSDFVTDLLPAVNPAYPTYQLTDQGTDIPQTLAELDAYFESQGLPPDHQLRAPIPVFQAGYAGLDAQAVQTGLLATLPDGQRALVLSYASAGRVTERGVEVSGGVRVTDEVQVAGSFTYFEFDEPEATALGDVVLPNTPERKGTISIQYRGRQGLDLGIDARLVSGYEWAAGFYQGYVEPSETFNVTAGYQIHPQFRLHAIATNVFDQKRFHMYGGSVIGRRVLGGVTATF